MLRSAKSRDRSTLRVSGPCIVCCALTSYGNGDGTGLTAAHVTFGDAWLDRHVRRFSRRVKPFVVADMADNKMPLPAGSADRAKTSPLEGIRTGLVRIGNLSYRTVRPYLCATCRSTHEIAVQGGLAVTRAKQIKEIERQRYEATARKPNFGEFVVERGTRTLTLLFSCGSVHRLMIQWRTSQRYCVGSRPAFVILLNANGRLEGRTRVPAYDGTSPSEPLDLAMAHLVAKWANRKLQKELSIASVRAIWNPLDVIGSWDANGGFPQLVRTHWIDGTSHTSLTQTKSLDEVRELLEFAGCTITESSSN